MPSKMYILVREKMIEENFGLAIVSVAHAAAICILQGQMGEVPPEFQDWIENSFRKVVCRVTDEQLTKAKEHGDFVEVTESALDNEVVCLMCQPRKEWPEFFKYLKLWK